MQKDDILNAAAGSMSTIEPDDWADPEEPTQDIQNDDWDGIEHPMVSKHRAARDQRLIHRRRVIAKQRKLNRLNRRSARR